MISKRIKDLKNRKNFNYQENSKLKLKFLMVNLLNRIDLKYKKRFLSFFFLKAKLKNISKTKIVFRCIFTNRNRGCLRIYSISRILLKEFFTKKLISNSSKASW